LLGIIKLDRERNQPIREKLRYETTAMSTKEATAFTENGQSRHCSVNLKEQKHRTP